MTLDGITIPYVLFWEDEFSWDPVGQANYTSVTGAFVATEAARTYGRPITLVGGEDTCWITRTTLLALQAAAAVPENTMIATLPDGRSFNVWFNRNAGEPIEVRQLTRWQGIPDADTQYALNTLRLITVAP